MSVEEEASADAMRATRPQAFAVTKRLRDLYGPAVAAAEDDPAVVMCQRLWVYAAMVVSDRNAAREISLAKRMMQLGYW